MMDSFGFGAELDIEVLYWISVWLTLSLPSDLCPIPARQNWKKHFANVHVQ
jgi:hypothetical protein